MSLVHPPTNFEDPPLVPVKSLFDDVMLDIETLSLSKHNALILSIGMVEFDPTAPRFSTGDHALFVPGIVEQILLGRHVDPKTQKFWADQPLLASAHWRDNVPGMALLDVFNGVRNFVTGKKRIWANGIMFDLVNVETLFEQAGFPCPWHYQVPRDMRDRCRDMEQTRPSPDLSKFTIIPHDPISDCITQAASVWSHYGQPNGETERG